MGDCRRRGDIYAQKLITRARRELALHSINITRNRGYYPLSLVVMIECAYYTRSYLIDRVNIIGHSFFLFMQHNIPRYHPFVLRSSLYVEREDSLIRDVHIYFNDDEHDINKMLLAGLSYVFEAGSYVQHNV